jgi:crossover junction endodeoxyribonuclease RuvC
MKTAFKFCGIDQSLTSTGVVVIQNDKVLRESVYSFPERPNYQHLNDMASVFYDIWENEYEAYGFEGYSFASKGNTLTRLVELGTMIRLTANNSMQGPNFIFAPQNLKKFVAGKTFKKDEMRLEVYKRWGYENKSNDLVDAYAIARYTQALYNHLSNIEQKLTSFQTQAIESWLKNKNGVYVDAEEWSDGECY